MDITTVNSSVEDSCTFVEIPPVTTDRVRYFSLPTWDQSTYARYSVVAEWTCLDITTNTAPSIPTLSSPASAAQLGTVDADSRTE